MRLRCRPRNLELTTAVSGRNQKFAVAAGEHPGPLVLPAEALGSFPQTVPRSAVAATVLHKHGVVACHQAERQVRWRKYGNGGVRYPVKKNSCESSDTVFCASIEGQNAVSYQEGSNFYSWGAMFRIPWDCEQLL